jgi:hypothetical protein
MTYRVRPLLLKQLRDDIAANPITFTPWQDKNKRQVAEIDSALDDGGRISAELARELRDDLVKAWEASSGKYRRKYWSQLKRFDEQTGNRVGNDDGKHGAIWGFNGHSLHCICDRCVAYRVDNGIPPAKLNFTRPTDCGAPLGVKSDLPR